jgi:hypothetical protein
VAERSGSALRIEIDTSSTQEIVEVLFLLSKRLAKYGLLSFNSDHIDSFSVIKMRSKNKIFVSLLAATLNFDGVKAWGAAGLCTFTRLVDSAH